jgi:hypothetical protein
MNEITLTLATEEVNALLQILGQLQNATNTYPLAMKINEQLNAQSVAEE